MSGGPASWTAGDGLKHKHPSVLWIEDDTNVIRWGVGVLTRAGFTVRTAQTARDGLAQIIRNEHDVVLLDWKFPECQMNGHDILRTARAAGVTTPVMVCTGYFGGTEEQDARAAGANDFFPKPLITALWITRITALLRNTHAVAGHNIKIPDTELHFAWHTRLLAQDLRVREDLAMALLPHLRQRLIRRWPRADDAMVNTAAEDGVLEYFDAPDKYDTSKSSLLSYVSVIAMRRMANQYRSARRRLAHEIAMGSDLPDLPLEVEPRPSRWRELRAVLRYGKTKQERAFLHARLRGENRTRALALILEVDTLPEKHQADTVRRVMERLRHRLLDVRRRTQPPRR